MNISSLNHTYEIIVVILLVHVYEEGEGAEGQCCSGPAGGADGDGSVAQICVTALISVIEVESCSMFLSTQITQ